MADRRDALKLLSVAACSATVAATAPSAPAPPRMGINLCSPAYWNTELPFVDLMRMAGAWSVRDAQGRELSTDVLALDAFDWPRRLPEGCTATTALATTVHLPRGRWTVLHEGRGRLAVEGGLQATASRPGRLECEATPRGIAGDVLTLLRISALDGGDPLRRIRVLMPGHEASAEREPWNPSFLARWRGWAALRFMDFMFTNNSRVRRWSDRARPEDRSVATRGVAAELLIDLANRCGSAPWLCMPHGADDDFVSAFAGLVRERLDPALAVYVEHSNEVWNAGFEQARHAAQQGAAQGLGGNAWQAQLRWHARRSREVFRLWSDAFAAARRGRLVRVLGTQGGNPWASRELLATGVAADADALAVGAYLSLMPSPGGEPAADAVKRWPLERVFEHLDGELAREAKAQQEQAALAKAQGLQLLAYEGGQHLVATGGAERDEALNALLQSANRDARMERVYERLFDGWQRAGGGLFCHYASVAIPNPWGSWGLLEQHDDDPATRPKYVATQRRAQQWRAGAR